MPELRSAHAPLRDGERCELPDLGLSFEILQVPGHTLSHIAFWGHGALFCGDTLFSAGCGRMFEGTPDADECFVESVAGPAAGHPHVLRSRIHGGQSAIRVDGGSGQSRRPRVSGTRASAFAPRTIPRCPRTLDAGNPGQSVSALRRSAVVRAAAERACRPAARRARPRYSACCAPGRISSASGTRWHGSPTTFSRGASCVVAGRLRQSARARRPSHDHIVAAARAAAPTEAPVDAPDAAGATPSLTMPREWQHHNGEDYDDLFDRMRAGFAFDEVQEPVDRSAARLVRAQSGLSGARVPARPALPVPHRHRGRGARHAAGIRAAAGGGKRLRALRLFRRAAPRACGSSFPAPACASA